MCSLNWVGSNFSDLPINKYSKQEQCLWDFMFPLFSADSLNHNSRFGLDLVGLVDLELTPTCKKSYINYYNIEWRRKIRVCMHYYNDQDISLA